MPEYQSILASCLCLTTLCKTHHVFYRIVMQTWVADRWLEPRIQLCCLEFGISDTVLPFEILVWVALNVFASFFTNHDSDVIMSAMASQITVVSRVYSTVCSGADQKKHQNSTSLAFVRGIRESTCYQWIPLTKGQKHGTCFYLMTSLWRNQIRKAWYAMALIFCDKTIDQ